MLKSIRPSVHPHEVDMGIYLSSEPLTSDSKNHCIPILGVLQVPDENDKILLVMPLLRSLDQPPFNTTDEAVGLFSQLFEAHKFLWPPCLTIAPQGSSIHARSPCGASIFYKAPQMTSSV